MPGDITIESRDRFTRLLQDYLEVRQGDCDLLILRKARSATFEFYKATVDAAPTKEQIKQAVEALGWRVKRRKGAWPYRKGEKAKNPQGPLNRMRAGVIGRRVKVIYYVSTGWLPAMKRLGGKSTGGKSRLQQIQNPKGKVTISYTGSGDLMVIVTNSTPGIARVEARHKILKHGFDAASEDIEKYLRAKDQGLSGVTVGGNK